MNKETKLSYWREEDEALAVSVNGTVTYYGADDSIMDVAAAMGLTKEDFTHLA
jgi:hypothetical protein